MIETLSDLAPILPVDPSTARLVVVDLSVDAPPLSDDPEDTAAATRAVERAMEDAGAEIGVGRYDEVRVCYDGDLFAYPDLRYLVTDPRILRIVRSI